MRTGILHLSDLHISNGNFDESLVTMIAKSINEVGHPENMIILITGDIVNRGLKSEFDKAKVLLELLEDEIRRLYKLNDCITILIPGNHDLFFNESKRVRKDLVAIKNLNDWETCKGKEIELLSNFNDFAKDFQCEFQDCISKEKIINLSGIEFYITLINSTPFSEIDDEDNSYGLHYFNSSEKLATECNKDGIYISASHYPFSWFDEASQLKLNENITKKTHICFFGHEHKSSSSILEGDDHQTLFVKGGTINDKGSSSFNVLLISNDSEEIEVFEFIKLESESIFKSTKPKKHRKQDLKTNSRFNADIEFINSLNKHQFQTIADKLIDIFVFPKLKTVNQIDDLKEQEILNIEDLQSFIDEKNCLIIEGQQLSGKTSLLKHIYFHYIEYCYVIYIDSSMISNNNFRQIIKHAFETQYSDKSDRYHEFVQTDSSEKILLIDNLDCLRRVDQNALLDYSKNIFKCTIVTRSYDQTIKSKNRIIEIRNEIEEEFVLRIQNMVGTRRKSLIVKALSRYRSNVGLNVEQIDKLFENMLVHFESKPYFILLFLESLNSVNFSQSGSEVFSSIYESNIMISLRTVDNADIELLLIILEEIAYFMFKAKKYPVCFDDIAMVIRDYNNTYNKKIDARDIVDKLLKSRVINNTSDYKFKNTNVLAYFIARSIIKRCFDSNEYDDFIFLLSNICFSIHSDILLFMAFISRNTNILEKVLNMAERHFDDIEFYSMQRNNISVLSKISSDEFLLPTKDEKHKFKEKKERVEERISEEVDKESLGIFNYEESDIRHDINRMISSLKYLEIISKVLPSFEARLKRDLKERYIKMWFDIPAKVIYQIFEKIDLETTVDEYLSDKKADDMSKLRRKVTEDILKICHSVALSILNIPAKHAASKELTSLLHNFDSDEILVRIQKLMLLENFSSFTQFGEKAIDLDKSTQNIVAKYYVHRIVLHKLMSEDFVGDVHNQKTIDYFFPSSVKDKNGVSRVNMRRKQLLFVSKKKQSSN